MGSGRHLCRRWRALPMPSRQPAGHEPPTDQGRVTSQPWYWRPVARRPSLPIRHWGYPTSWLQPKLYLYHRTDPEGFGLRRGRTSPHNHVPDEAGTKGQIDTNRVRGYPEQAGCSWHGWFVAEAVDLFRSWQAGDQSREGESGEEWSRRAGSLFSIMAFVRDTRSQTRQLISLSNKIITYFRKFS